MSALILAGGAGRRAGGQDKGLLPWRGRPLVAWVYERIAAQSDEVLISCNRNREAYARIGCLAPADLREGFQGPLAGLEAARNELGGEFILLAPCDMPDLPVDLASALGQALDTHPEVQAAYASAGGDNHYLCALLRRNCLATLPSFLDAGGRAVRHWYAQIGAVSVAMDTQASQFTNLNHGTQ
ncbi:molybdenum cofactor guanylyltransferase MobA [Mangrovimicrobium sediminis]|uniref:molybdenum cofactor guanylyltransferase MobA n=1 Tax=Mangrovimicrobium sediminis TaxID=2562682 RepID=UPI001436BADA|nr:molybdenum cofactor guanylyltransferase MobA [Haliea sp. SAOS-164]